MENIGTKIITWAARIFGIAVPITISAYLLERVVFNWPEIGFPISFYKYELATIIFFSFLIFLAWKRPIAGAIIYLVIWPFFFIYVLLEHGLSPQGRGPSILLAIPPLIAGVLFLVSGLQIRASRKKTESSSHTPAD